jgi:hypothetical protein
MRFGLSAGFGLSFPAPPRGTAGDSACLSRSALVQISFNHRCGFVGSRERIRGDETLMSDSFGIGAGGIGGSLVDVCGRALNIGGSLQPVGLFQRGVLSFLEGRQYEWLLGQL